jgi:hypothetical protein
LKNYEPPPTIDENQNITPEILFGTTISIFIKSFKIHTMRILILKVAFYLRNFRTINKFKTINTKLHKTIEDRGG